MSSPLALGNEGVQPVKISPTTANTAPLSGLTVELLKTTRAEKEAAEKELSGARSQISRLEKELDELRKERDMVKIKVESLLKNLTELTEESVV